MNTQHTPAAVEQWAVARIKELEQQRDELLKSASAILTRIDNSISGHYTINFGACSDEVADLRKAIAKAGG